MSDMQEPKSPVLYIMIAGVLIILLKMFVFDGRTPFQDTIYESLHKDVVHNSSEAQSELEALTQDEGDEDYNLYEKIQEGFLKLDVPMPSADSKGPVDLTPVDLTPVDLAPVEEKKSQIEGEEKAQEDRLAVLHKAPVYREDPVLSKPKGKPGESPDFVRPQSDSVRVAVVIDDMGVSRHYSLEMIKLDPALTLSFLPYAPKLDDITQEAVKAGHELMLHVPMEAMDSSMDLGPMALRSSMDELGFKNNLYKILESFEGYEGINNHMGSLLTQDEEKMEWVMDVMKIRDPDLYFLDSKTISGSIAAQVAGRNGLAFAERQVFLDHVDDLKAIEMRLRLLEESARHRGYAIAIGHPRKATFEALKAWIPTLEGKNIELVPASALMARPAKKVVQPILNKDEPQKSISSERLLSPNLMEGVTFPKHPVRP